MTEGQEMLLGRMWSLIQNTEDEKWILKKQKLQERKTDMSKRRHMRVELPLLQFSDDFMMEKIPKEVSVGLSHVSTTY